MLECNRQKIRFSIVNINQNQEHKELKTKKDNNFFLRIYPYIPKLSETVFMSILIIPYSLTPFFTVISFTLVLLLYQCTFGG